jgi:hypothetical protein
MMDRVMYGTPWSDPGATATDDIDGNITSQIQTFGVGSVDANSPTAEGSVGYVVEYYIEDASKNAAPIGRRLVQVICPDTESVCTDPDSNLLTCTTKGMCGKQLSALQGGSSARASAPGSAAAASSQSPREPPALPKPPTMTLVGLSAQEVLAGTMYDRCSPGATVGALCDEGATAEDEKDGNLNRMVMVCGNRWGSKDMF